jgi:hypothetical protein
MTTSPLSPAAQAILDAAVGEAHPAFAPIARPMAAVVLRAAANQVVPPENDKRGICHSYIRDEFLAIANELDTKTKPPL